MHCQRDIRHAKIVCHLILASESHRQNQCCSFNRGVVQGAIAYISSEQAERQDASVHTRLCDGTQKLPPCTRSGVSQAASAVHLTALGVNVMWYPLRSFRTFLPCCAALYLPSAIDLLVPQTDRIRLNCSSLSRPGVKSKRPSASPPPPPSTPVFVGVDIICT